MMKSMQTVICCILLAAMFFTVIESRPPSVGDNNQELDNIEPDVEEVRNSYYELPAETAYSSIPIDRLQMLIAQYRPSAYLRSAGFRGSMNDLFRVPETKRQVRYRQCYFNPISCFKK